MPKVLSFLSLLALAWSASAAIELTALQAVKLLPKDAWPRVARVNAFEGDPAPERWHILVHDTREGNGLHEYVVAHGEVVASRGVSQFAEELKPDDIIGSDAVKIDSDRAASIARQYAEANKLPMASCNYELKKDGDGAVPLWRVTCVDEKGEELGQIMVTASKGTVVRHEGFAIEPPLVDAKLTLAQQEAQYRREVQAWREKQARKMAQPQPGRVTVATPLPAGPPAAERPGFFQRAGNSVGKMFGGGR